MCPFAVAGEYGRKCLIIFFVNPVHVDRNPELNAWMNVEWGGEKHA